MQLRISSPCGHEAPPFCGATIVRLRDCEPLPHDVVHVDHESKALTTQFTGHK